MLERYADIFMKLKDYGCVGFKFSTNDSSLANLLAELIADMRRHPGRNGLLAPSF